MVVGESSVVQKNCLRGSSLSLPQAAKLRRGEGGAFWSEANKRDGWGVATSEGVCGYPHPTALRAATLPARGIVA